LAHDNRENRLQTDHETLQALQECSSILRVEGSGDPPDRYTITFLGKGLSRDISSRSDVQITDQHRIDMRLPYAYPRVAPDIRWVTPILHPNVSFSGFIHLRDIGLPWDDSVTLDAVCERLWDVARMAYMNLDRATNFSAKTWCEKQSRIALPVDSRALRDRMPPAESNVVRYKRRESRRIEMPQADGDVFYIGEDTPPPPVPGRPYRPRKTRSDDDDIFYIGDE
jgi:ubiquitin-protein ligase